MFQLQAEYSVLPKWQKLLNLISLNFQLPVALIMRLDGDWIEVFMKCNSAENPYILGHKEKLDGLYCNEVILSQKKLLVPNALNDKDWNNNPDIALGLISYLGYPLFYPNGDVFGTLCILDKKENAYSDKIDNLLKDIKKLIELDLKAFYEYDYKREALEEKIFNTEGILSNETLLKTELRLNEKGQLLNQLKRYHTKNLTDDLNYKNLISNLKSAFVIFKPVFDKNGNIFDAEYIDMNTYNEKIIGFKKSEVIGKTILDVFPETEKEWFNKFTTVVANNHHLKFEMYHSPLKSYFNVNAFPTDEGNFAVVYDDVTDYVNAREKEAVSNFNYRQLFDKINTAIEVYTPIYDFNDQIIDLRYVDMNPLNEEIIQLPRHKVIGKTLMEVFPGTEPEFFSHFDKIKKVNETHQFDIFYAPLNMYLSCSVFKLQDNTFVLTYNNITERIESFRKLRESERRHKAIFQDSGSIMLLINPLNGKIVDANHAAINYTGYPRDVLLSMNIDQINISKKEHLAEEMMKVSKGEKNYFEFQHRIASGEIRNVEVYASSFEENGLKLLHSIIFDVTEKKKAMSESLKFSAIIEKAPVSVVITDKEGVIIYANKQNEILTGYSPNELIGKKTNILKSGKTPMVEYEKLWNTILSGKIWDGEFYNRKKDGSYYWELATIAPIYDKIHDRLNFVRIGKDVTERKEMEIELLHAKAKAEESDRLKSSFLSNLSHEIRTPLNGILGFSDMLQDDKLPKEKRKMYGDIVDASGEQLLMIISDLVRTSELESGTLSIKNSMFQIKELLEEVKDFHFETCASKGVNLFIKHDSFSCNDFISDRKRIRQVLDNFINNAIKFTQEGKIELAAKRINGSILFSVKDTGNGISKEDQRIIFERFRQVEGDDSIVNEGNGLGLYINKEIVELLGGEIWVESEFGLGSTFKFTVKRRDKIDF
ncbi:PAS domain S-box protein [Marinifilum flexuosum]|uniref:histidine kinase n=1 Tax=Marinifilum flexuosum TaxID=1117708 RepID=A0A419X9X1_9BACT|nr:PAS domain S-box protein [Marinifilum flexuosum]RKE04370.1 PAS domain S-box-containing protein [Marinifilum flexuosum]